MSDRTGISWTSATWNPTTGCDRVSEGCDRCYALALAARLKAMGNPRYQVDGDPRRSGPGFGLTLHWDKLAQPTRWRSPRRIFVNSMSDLGHEAIPFEFFSRIFDTMAATPRHTYQVLTKRPAPLRTRVARWYAERQLDAPLPNVWLGVSVENQRWAEVRIPRLLEMPAAVRFLSCEPLLGAISLGSWTGSEHEIQWVIVGGETGVGFRPLDPDWARSIRDQCLNAGIAFFYKQGSGIRPEMDRLLDEALWEQMPTASAVAVSA
jgi:protein gp37